MFTALLILIYISFISLGLPDSLLGSSWPAISQELGVSLSYAGAISMIISGGTIISSLFSEKLIRKFDTGTVTFVSVFMTAISLIGFSIAGNFWLLCFFAVPLGLGAGSVDAALNNFVALHYKAKHMSWLHCFWGIGATAGPVIMSFFLVAQSGWKQGYRTIGFIQMTLVIVLIFSIPLWKKVKKSENQECIEKDEEIKFKNVFTWKGVKPALFTFFCYCGLEATTGLWGSSFLVLKKGIDVKTAASWISLYFLGITVGRLLSGFITLKLNNKAMIRMGQVIIFLGILSLMIGSNHAWLQSGFVLVGLGCAPIYPCLLHETPNRFGKSKSQAMMGIQMASAYVGSTFMPPIFGVIAQYIDMIWFPLFLLVLLVLMVGTSERVNKIL